MKHSIPDDWDGTFCRFAICWPDSTLWRALLRGLVTEPARGFFWDEKTGSIRGVLADFRQTVDHNLDLPEVFMACNDQNIATALQAIATALVTASANAAASANASANACCEQSIINQGGGVSGYITQPGTGTNIPIYGTQPPKNIPSGQWPDGFDNRQEYDLDKCQMANLIFDDLIESLRRIGAITTFNTIALAGLLVASVVGAIIFPPSAIGVAVGVLIVIAGTTGVIAGLILGLQERREDVVCALYTSDSVDAIIATIADILDAIIALIPVGGTVATALKTLALVLLNSDTLNQLFQAQAHANYPNADCSSCEEDALCWFFTEGLDGFTYRNTFGTWGTSGGSLEWLSDGAAIQNGFGNPGYSGMISPEIEPYTIQAGDVICVQISNFLSAGAHSQFVGAVIDGQEIELSTSFGTLSQGAGEVSLETYAGQNITQIFLGWYHAGTFWVHIDSIGINCPACV